ncbi:MAG: hypothetical protein FWD23_17435 [Oscillospiraceae bacterium]|nr:hypothetical protein [Oscillospiraceae bacterium]
MERILAGVTADTFKSMQLGVGAIIRDFEYETIKTPEEFKTAFKTAILNGQSFGGTRGGINVEIVPTLRKRDVDGASVSFKGDSVIDEWVCQMSCSLVEFSPQVWQAAFPTSEYTEVGATGSGIVAARIRTSLAHEDYDINHTWIATTDFGYIMVSMFNAIGGTTGAIAAADKSEGTIPFQTKGTIEDFEDIDFAPVEIWWVDMGNDVIDIGKVKV